MINNRRSGINRFLALVDGPLTNGVVVSYKGERVDRCRRPGKVTAVGLGSDFWYFLRTQKKWWLTPLVVVVLLLSVLIICTESSSLAPYVYSIF